ncbi:hypothetical protein V2J09_013573 [Rumex salicifolius]
MAGGRRLELRRPVMLGILCARSPKPWILSSLSSSFSSHHHHIHPLLQLEGRKRRFHRSASLVKAAIPGGVAGAVSVWHANVPEASGAADWRRDFLLPTAAIVNQRRQRGEGSWNVAWDARPLRWIYRLDLAWLLFGVSAFLSPVDWNDFVKSQVSAPVSVDVKDQKEVARGKSDSPGVCDDKSSNGGYRVTGVPADGRCLFRAIAHGACLKSGEEAPDENRQRELADELRAQVVDELLKRREETEWFIEGDFDAYVKRLRQPFVWGGEPELLMASHVLKTPIAVYMRDKSSGNLSNIANYGEEYQKDKEVPINVLFHGYGHYDLLEMSSSQRCENGIM